MKPHDAIHTPTIAIKSALTTCETLPSINRLGDMTKTNGMIYAIQPNRTAVAPVAMGLAPASDAAANAAMDGAADLPSG